MRNATASTTGFSPSSRPSLPPADYSYPLTNPQQGALADHRVQVREVEAAMQGVEPEPPRGGCLPHRGSGQPLPRGGAFSACTMVAAHVPGNSSSPAGPLGEVKEARVWSPGPRSTFPMKATTSRSKLVVSSDGRGVVGHAGARL